MLETTEAGTMKLALLTAAGAAPALALVRHFVVRDHYREPTGHVIAAFVLGIAIIPLVLLVGVPVKHALDFVEPAYLHGAVDAFLVAAVPEEGFKLLVVAGVCARWRDFDEPMDGIVYGAAASLGFACLENVLYVLGGGWTTAALRAMTAVPAHACFGALMGYHVALAKFDRAHARTHLAAAFLLPTLLHGLYDTPLFGIAYSGSLGPFDCAFGFTFVLSLLVGMMVVTRKRVRVARSAQVQHEATRDVVL